MSDQAEQSQPVLFELQEDGALLFSREELERTKRYTAEQVKNLEWKRNAVVMLLGSDWPVETIAAELHISTRTVRAIAARSAQEVACSTKMFARICQGLGARWLGLAKTKEHEASFLQLATAGAIAVDKAVLLESMGQFADVTETKGGEDRARAMATLRAMMADQVPSQAPATDVQSDAQPGIPGHSGASPSNDAPGDAPGQVGDQVPSQAPAGGPGGGQTAAGQPGSPMGPGAQGLQPSDALEGPGMGNAKTENTAQSAAGPPAQ